MKLSSTQIAQYIRNAGATETQVPVMVAIALAESGGETTAKGDVNLETSTWGPSVGLWQIRSLNSQKGTGGTRDELANTDPQHNANSAMSILRGSGLSAWSTYTNQAYKQFLNVDTSGTAGTPVTTTANNNPLSGLAKVFTTLADKGTWERIGIVGFGAAALWIGVIMIVKSNGAYQAAAHTATSIAKVVK